MPNDYPNNDLCTIPTIWTWCISEGHSSHFNCDIVKIQKPDKSYPNVWCCCGNAHFIDLLEVSQYVRVIEYIGFDMNGSDKSKLW